MKIIKYTCSGTVHTEMNNGRKNIKLYNKWMDNCSKQLERIGLPCRPIMFTYRVVITFYNADFRSCNNTDMTASINKALIANGIISDQAYKYMPRTEQRGIYRRSDPGYTIKIYADEKHPHNDGVPWKQFPVIKEMPIKQTYIGFKKG